MGVVWMAMACVAGGVHGSGVACMAGGMCGGEHVWWGA